MTKAKDILAELDPEDPLDIIRDALGPWGDSQSLEARDYWAMMNHLSQWITKYYGHRCPQSSGGCVCCQVWGVYDLARVVFMSPD